MSTEPDHEHVDEGAHGRLSHAHRYPLLDKWMTRTPWAVRPEMLQVLQEIRRLRLDGLRFSADELEQRVRPEAARGGRPQRRAGAIAVIPLQGVIIPRATAFTAMSGGMTLADFRGMLRAAVDDPDVTAIVLDVDSPGGSVDQVPETAAEVRAAAARKPVWAVANTDAYSAAYWIASQASQLWVTPSGGVGSIGVYAAHQDFSAQEEMDGVRTTLISYGDRKTDGNPHEPLSAEALASIQADVNTFGEMFVAEVAKGRGVKASVVRSDFGQGAIVLAKAAVAAGMADKVGTIEQAIGELARGRATPGRGSASSMLTPNSWTSGDVVQGNATGVVVEITGDSTFLGDGFQASLRSQLYESVSGSGPDPDSVVGEGDGEKQANDRSRLLLTHGVAGHLVRKEHHR